MKFYTVYILQSEINPAKFYTGITELPVEERLQYHNKGKVFHTAKYCPWKIKTYIVYTDKNQAYAFEKYLKSPSGRAFAKKHL